MTQPNLNLPKHQDTSLSTTIQPTQPQATMPLITEISWLPFKPNTESSAAATALKDLGPQLASQPGLDSHWRGAPLERPNSLEFVNGPSPSPHPTNPPLTPLPPPPHSLDLGTSLRNLANLPPPHHRHLPPRPPHRHLQPFHKTLPQRHPLRQALFRRRGRAARAAVVVFTPDRRRQGCV